MAETPAALDAATLAELRARLMQEWRRLRGLKDDDSPDRQAIIRDADPDDALATEPQDFADMGYDIMMQDTEMALSENDRRLLAQVELALQRMEDGTYGFSTVTGKPIPLERLQTLPWVTTNVEDAPDGGRMEPSTEY